MGILHGTKAYGGPIQANLSLTNACNMKCHHCYYHSPFLAVSALRPVRKARLDGRRFPEASEMDRLSAIEADPLHMHRLLDELLSMGTIRFHFSGGGEPLLHPNALEFMDRVCCTGGSCDVNTNGLLLTREMMTHLIHLRCNALRITLSAGTREMYHRTHSCVSGESFDRLEKNLCWLAEKKKSLGIKKPEVTLVCVVTRDNHEGLLDVARFGHLVAADSVHYKPLDAAGDDTLSKLIPTAAQSAVAAKQLLAAKLYLESKKIEHNIDSFFNVFRHRLDSSTVYDKIPCYYGWLSVSIDADGSHYFCCRSYEPLGNVFEDGFGRIWHSREYRLKRSQALHLPRRRRPVPDSDCWSCIHHLANYRVYNMLHPLKSVADRLQVGNRCIC